jgi:hypothetical protein
MSTGTDRNILADSRAKRSREPEPETRVGNCCGCNTDPMVLFKIQGIYRYRCAECFEVETGYRHHLSPPPQPAGRILLP